MKIFIRNRETSVLPLQENYFLVFSIGMKSEHFCRIIESTEKHTQHAHCKTFTCSKSTIETLERAVKYIKR